MRRRRRKSTPCSRACVRFGGTPDIDDALQEVQGGKVVRSWRTDGLNDLLIPGTMADGDTPGDLPAPPVQETKQPEPAAEPAAAEPAAAEPAAAEPAAAEPAAAEPAASKPDPTSGLDEEDERQAESEAAAGTEDAEDPRDAELDRLRKMVAGQHEGVTPPPPPVGEIDLSDMPNPYDEDKYPEQEDGQKALAAWREEVQRKLATMTAAQQQQFERQVQEVNGRAVMRQIEFMSGLDPSEFEKRRQEVEGIRSETWNGDSRTPPNPVNHGLAYYRQRYLQGRQASGISNDGYMPVAGMIAEQIKDVDFARQVANVVPDNNYIGGQIVAAVAEQPDPVRVLRHLVSDEGRDWVQSLVAVPVDYAKLTDHQKVMLFDQVRQDVARIDARLEAAGITAGAAEGVEGGEQATGQACRAHWFACAEGPSPGAACFAAGDTQRARGVLSGVGACELGGGSQGA